MLCLPSGERIRLDAARMRVLFEVEDLAHASPATVSRRVRGRRRWWQDGGRHVCPSPLSTAGKRHAHPRAAPRHRSPPARCGMVYAPPDALGWRPFARSWLQALPLASGSVDAADGDIASQLNAAAAAGEGGAAVPLQPVQELIWGLLEAFVDPLLRWVRAHGRLVVATADVALVQAAATLLGQLLAGRG
jgi:hypothetical protein